MHRLDSRYRRGRTLDLAKVIVVVPVDRAARRLEELFGWLADEQQLCLTPPRIVTQKNVPELLYPLKRPLANDLVQELAWTRAVRETPEEIRQHLVPHPPAGDEFVRWLGLGRTLHQLHLELAADGLDFEAVGRTAATLPGFPDAERWRALGAAQKRYLGVLQEHELWDRETARLKAIEYREITLDGDIFLLATVDLNQTLRKLLDQVSTRVTAYIAAPDELANRFDAYGCLVTSAWCEASVPLTDEQLCQVDGPEEQADCVTSWLATLGGRYRKEDVVIGVPDPALAPQLQRQLEQCGVPSRRFERVTLADTAPYRLLFAAAQYASGRRYADLAALIRHPDVERWVRIRSARTKAPFSLAGQLDQYYAKHFPARILPPHVAQYERFWPELTSALKQIEKWLAAATSEHGLREWCTIFRKLLATVYGKRTLQLDQPLDETLHAAFKRIVQALDRIDGVPERLDTVPITAENALSVILGPSADKSIPPPAGPEAVEILGWLELPLDDAPALVITSFNEGFVPQAIRADGFLPDRLRRELGLADNERRYARDVYATTVLCESRQELSVIFARRDTQKDPLRPSRLVFACPPADLVRRAQRYFSSSKESASRRRLLLARSGSVRAESTFAVPPPKKQSSPLTHMSVTRFKDYLACPYRYYLRHLEKLEAVGDAVPELDGREFGKLLHRVLGAFGREGPRDCASAKTIMEFLEERLGHYADTRFGPDFRRPAIRLQLEQARKRLRAFAARQVDLVREGWRIAYAENEEAEDCQGPFLVDTEPITLVGRIDRIDFHEARRTWRILDYKTSDSALSPEKSHRKGESWIGLQLPLYRHLRGGELPDLAGAIELAYFNLPKRLEQTGIQQVDWDDAMLQSADEAARTVVRGLRAGSFWPPNYDPVPPYSEDLAAICLDHMNARPSVAESDEEERA